MNTPTHILVTGATGLLGRPTLRALSGASPRAAQAAGWRVTGAALRRTSPGLERIDLSQPGAIPPALDRLAPDVIIPAAAERRPDVSERDPDGTRRLNVGATAAIARWAAARRAFLIYISSDYVFDGARPPYRPGDAPHPLNAYGQSKLDGEHAIQSAGCDAAILRVPLLYGDVESLGESSVTLLAESMLRAPPGSPLPMEHWATRYPTHTGDVAEVLRQLTAHRLATPGFSGIFHWSGREAMTKYDIARIFAPLIGFDPARLIPDTAQPLGAPRPRDAHLDRSGLERLGIGRDTPFASAAAAILAKHVPLQPAAPSPQMG
jgi:dTDP-4-dehydrorhamnose reductase